MYHEKLKSPKRRAARPLGEVSKGRDKQSKSVSAPMITAEAIRRALWFGAILAVTFCVYSNSLHAPFLMDSNQVVLGDARIHAAAPGNLARILNEPYTPLTGLYRPATTLSYLLNYAILGNGPGQTGYHWFNLILHGVNAALVYALALAVFDQLPVAVLVTGVWSLHPVQVEAVTNIVGRADMLAAFGVLAALFCHRKALQSAGRRKVAWLVGIAFAMTVGMFSKESAIVALALVPLYDATFGEASSWRSRIPSYIALVIPCLALLVVRASVLAKAPAAPFPFVDNPLIGADFWTARLTAIKVIGKYLLLLAWPAQLSYDYSYNAIPVSADWKAFLALIVCLAALVIALRSYRRCKPLFFFILFFFVAIAPVSNIFLIVGTIMGERLLYLPSAAFAACAGFAIYSIARRIPANSSLRHAGLAAAGLILLALAARTYARNNDWSDAQRFWNSGLQSAPGSFKPHLAVAHITSILPEKDWTRAAAEADRALAILAPLPPLDNVSLPYRDAGAIYRAVGEASAANPASNPVPGSAPEDWYRKSLGALLRSEKIELARDEQLRVSNARRGILGFITIPSVLYLELGQTYGRLHDSARALDAFERGRALDPDPDLLKNLADAYLAAGEPGKAAAALVEAVVADPGRADLSARAVDVYAQIDPQGCAVIHNGAQRSLNLGCPLVQADLCSAARNVAAGLDRAGRSLESEAARRSAVQAFGCPASHR
jgi:tetratricopeptide (TPR) repeat protein